ncbi:hypothetical protein LY76DRAFT_562745 [Colletotrichum caudatum]|nr:hypothetical protein LY76DRAFT_562745 [Colletotrichum caudatum]
MGFLGQNYDNDDDDDDDDIDDGTAIDTLCLARNSVDFSLCWSYSRTLIGSTWCWQMETNVNWKRSLLNGRRALELPIKRMWQVRGDRNQRATADLKEEMTQPGCENHTGCQETFSNGREQMDVVERGIVERNKGWIASWESIEREGGRQEVERERSEPEPQVGIHGS